MASEYAPDTLVDLKPLTELRAWLWDRPGLRQTPGATLQADELLRLYEARWRYIDPDAMSDVERRVLEALIRDVGGGRFEPRSHLHLRDR